MACFEHQGRNILQLPATQVCLLAPCCPPPPPKWATWCKGKRALLKACSQEMKRPHTATNSDSTVFSCARALYSKKREEREYSKTIDNTISTLLYPFVIPNPPPPLLFWKLYSDLLDPASACSTHSSELRRGVGGRWEKHFVSKGKILTFKDILPCLLHYLKHKGYCLRK